MSFLDAIQAGVRDLRLVGSDFEAEPLNYVRWALVLATSSTAASLTIDGCSDLCCQIVAEVLQINRSLRSFTVRAGDGDISNQTGIAMAEALKQTALQSFTLRAFGTQISDQTGIAMAEALKQTALQSFALDAFGTQISDQTGIAMAEALKQTALQSFTLHAFETQISDQTGIAMAEALKQTALQSFALHAYRTQISDQTGIAMAGALKHNHTLLTCQTSPDFGSDGMAPFLCRNMELLQMWRALAALARRGEVAGLRNLVSYDFRRQLLSYFMAPGCTASPRYFSTAVDGKLQPCVTVELAHVSAYIGASHTPSQAASSVPLAAGASERHLRDEVEQDVKVMLATTRDEQELLEREAAELAQALQLSKAELPKEELVLLRLVKRARSPQVVEALRGAPELEPCRRRMAEAGCELRPEWAGGAWLLVPLREPELFALLEDSLDLSLQDWHVLLRQSDVQLLRRALRGITNATAADGFRETRSAQAWADLDSAAPDDTGLSSMASDAAAAKAFAAATAERGTAVSGPEPTSLHQVADAEPAAELLTHIYAIERTFITVKEPELGVGNFSTPRSAPP
jgi:hypothetical protein